MELSNSVGRPYEKRRIRYVICVHDHLRKQLWAMRIMYTVFMCRILYYTFLLLNIIDVEIHTQMLSDSLKYFTIKWPGWLIWCLHSQYIMSAVYR